MRTQLFVLLALVAAVAFVQAADLAEGADCGIPDSTDECVGDDVICNENLAPADDTSGATGVCAVATACDGDDDCTEEGEECIGFDEGVLGTCGPDTCAENADCTDEGEVCNPDGGVCVEATCNEDKDCKRKEFCVTEVVVPLRHGGTNNGPNTGLCVDKVADEGPCEADNQCLSGKCSDQGECEKTKKKKKPKKKSKYGKKNNYGKKAKKSKKSKFGGYGKKSNNNNKYGKKKSNNNNKYGKQKSNNKYGKKNSRGKKY